MDRVVEERVLLAGPVGRDHSDPVAPADSVGPRRARIQAGEPGIRPDYGGFYYAAFIIDPDGYRLEAYFHKGEL